MLTKPTPLEDIANQVQPHAQLFMFKQLWCDCMQFNQIGTDLYIQLQVLFASSRKLAEVKICGLVHVTPKRSYTL